MKPIIIDVLGVLGFAAFVEGVREVYPPAALIVGGMVAVAFAWHASKE